jgi:hypothetical protein
MKTNVIRQAVLTTAFMACMGLGYAQKKPTTKTTVSPSETIRTIEVESYATDPAGETRMRFKKGGEDYSMKLVGEEVTELTIDGKKVAAENMHQYKDLIDAMVAQLKKDRIQAEEDRKQAAIDRAQAQKDRERIEIDRVQANKDREQANRDRQQAMRDRAQAEKERERAIIDRKQAEIDRKHAEEDRALIKTMLEAAVKDGLIADADAVTQFELSGEGLWINGKKQPDGIHQKYKAAYLKKPDSKFSFSRTATGTRHSIINLK